MRLLLTGGIHIGRTSTRMPRGVPADERRAASAWLRLVDLARDERVDVVCLSGDVADAENRFWEAIGPLEAGIRRLAEAGIRTVAVAGTADDSRLPDRVSLYVRTERPRHGSTKSISLRGDDRASDFEYRFGYGRISVVAYAKGFASTEVGPFLTEPGGKIDNIDIELDRGFMGRVQLLGSDGELLSDVAIGYYSWFGNSGLADAEVITDESGVATIEHAVDQRCQMGVRLPGYQYERREVELAPDTTLRWQLMPARPTRGVVVDESTGRPVAGARFYLARRVGLRRHHD